jgi:hypothetical protein
LGLVYDSRVLGITINRVLGISLLVVCHETIAEYLGLVYDSRVLGISLLVVCYETIAEYLELVYLCYARYAAAAVHVSMRP